MPSNTEIAELLAQQAERETGIPSRAYRRAARSAFLWPEEAFDLIIQNRTLTELRSVGPFIERQIRRWIDKPPSHTKTVPAIRRDFISLAEHNASSQPDLPGAKSCAAICRSTLVGAMDRPQSQKWPMPLRTARIITSQ